MNMRSCGLQVINNAHILNHHMNKIRALTEERRFTRMNSRVECKWREAYIV